MNNYPKISIITPVKNGQDTIEKTIKSLIAQNYTNLEYIIIEGESTDKTSEIIKKYKKYVDIYLKNDWNSIKAENEGIKMATGEIIAFLNADDFYEENTLLKIAQEFQQNPQLDIVSCLYRVIKQDENGNYVAIETTTQEKMQLEKNKIITSYGINARFFKKSIFEKYGFMIEKDDKNRTFMSNDIEHTIRILLKGIKNKTINHIGYNYFSHEKSNTFCQNIETKIRLFEDKIFIAKMFLNSKNFELPEIWQKTFIKWKKKYRTKIIKIYFAQFEFKKAISEFRTGFKDS